jgi:hypothetical protein
VELKELTVEEINLTLAGLAKLPFEQVNTLITKIHAQGQSQLKSVEQVPVEVVE